MNDTFNPDEASGHADSRTAEPLILNKVSLNGDGDAEEIDGKLVRKGGFFRKTILINAPKDEKPEEINLGTEVTLVFLKKRRKLVERGAEGKIIRSTNEHNTKQDAVTLFHKETNKRENGVAVDLREKYPNLRTIEIVYALLVEGAKEPELVRLEVKGASLGSEEKAETTTDYYKYLNSFKGDERFYHYKTVLKPVLEKGKKSYFVIDFNRGEKLSDKSYEYAMDVLRDVHMKLVEADKIRASRIGKFAEAPADDMPSSFRDGTRVPAGEEDVPQEVTEDDIPF